MTRTYRGKEHALHKGAVARIVSARVAQLAPHLRPRTPQAYVEYLRLLATGHLVLTSHFVLARVKTR